MPIYSFVLLPTCCGSLVSYVLAAVRAFLHAPLSVRAKKWRMAMFYPMNFVVTSGCLAVATIWPSLWNIALFSIFNSLALSLNGLINALTYYLQSWTARSRRPRRRYGRRSLASGDTSQNLSFNVVFSPAVETHEYSLPNMVTGVREEMGKEMSASQIRAAERDLRDSTTGSQSSLPGGFWTWLDEELETRSTV